MVTVMPEPSDSPRTDCTKPLPKVFWPTNTARLLSCRAPERISLALAEPSFTSTTMGLLVRARPLARLTSWMPSRVLVDTIVPSFSHWRAISTLAISRPPGLLRRSST